MTRWILLVFATIVLTPFAYSATDIPLGKNLDDSPKSKQEEENKPNSNYEFDLAPIKKFPKPENKQNEKPAYLTKNYSFNPTLSFGYSTENQTIYAIGFQYLNFKNNLKSEWGFNLYNQGDASISLSRKWFFFDWGKFQAHSKFGLGLYMNPSQGIATIVDIKNFGLNMQFGFEKLLSQPLSLRGDIDLLATQRNVILMINLGYSWAW
jgi:hypothetical protein